MGFGECGLKYFGNLFWLEMEKGKQKDKIPNEKMSSIIPSLGS